MALYPNEMVALQIDRAMGPRWYLQQTRVNLRTARNPAITDVLDRRSRSD